jgi:IS30 family transposase
VHRSTISRELRRNTGERGYRPKQAHEKAIGRRAKAKPRITVTTWEVVEEKLREDWSPEQVSGWMKKRQGIQISHGWIYQHILADKQAGGDLHTHLPKAYSALLEKAPKTLWKERKSRFTLMQPVDQRLADLVSQAMISLLSPFVDWVHTITGDNGKEFVNHAQIAEALKAAFYFAHPYSAWERGTNENTNGLIRQYFP